MTRRYQWPSKWWFWIAPGVALLHVLVVLALYFAAVLLPDPVDDFAEPCYILLGYPIYLFGDALDPVLEILNPDDILMWDVAQTLVLWVLAGVPVGVGLYALAALVSLVVPRDTTEQVGER